jgi:hypothetical protein
MDVSGRSLLNVPVVVVVSAATVVLSPAMPTGTPASPAVQLTSAAVWGPELLDSAALAAQSLGGDLEAFYNAVEPWAAYGVEFVSWAVGWVPVAGLLAPQLIFFYDLGESITQSLVFNTADLFDGTITFAQALTNISTATTDAFNAFINTEIGWIQGLLPPLPPLGVDLPALADLGGLAGLVP